jgi:hypothetical protein
LIPTSGQTICFYVVWLIINSVKFNIILSIHRLNIMDILYYSNYCQYSQQVIQFLVKNNLADKVNCICIDKRSRDVNNNQTYITLETGQKIVLPPNVHSVPALLQVKNNYSVILGPDIIEYYKPRAAEKTEQATMGDEPVGVLLSSSSAGVNIVSEQYTMYNMTPDELSTKGKGGNRQMYNYVPATHDSVFIPTPPDTYRPDKLSGSVTVDSLQQQRNSEMPKAPNMIGMSI